jgi:diacylglycerol kinase (ATP)
MRVSIVVNPVSGARHGGGAGTARTKLAERLARAHGVTAVHVTTASGDARRLAQRAAEDGADLVVAWGGDGTVNEVAAALAGTRTSLGIVPAGSGNGLARELGVPGDAAGALAHALGARPRSIDAGEIGGRLFVNIAGIGLDARIARRFNARRARRRGFVTYVAVTVAEIARGDVVVSRIELPGEYLDTRASLVAFANSSQYGNGARVAPGARIDDGLLDMVVVEAASALGTLWRARRLFDGSVLGDRSVRHRRVTTARVSAPEPLLFHVDGEPVEGPATLDVRVRPGAVLVCA